jgi:hypothetical protein
MKYTLYNKRNKKQLIHPSIGLWFSENKKEADEMLDDCLLYLESIGLGHTKDDYIVMEVEDD